MVVKDKKLEEIAKDYREQKNATDIEYLLISHYQHLQLILKQLNRFRTLGLLVGDNEKITIDLMDGFKADLKILEENLPINLLQISKLI